jgi:hypothetical protein
LGDGLKVTQRKMFLESDNVREAVVKSFDKPVKYKKIVLLCGEVILVFGV